MTDFSLDILCRRYRLFSASWQDVIPSLKCTINTAVVTQIKEKSKCKYSQSSLAVICTNGELPPRPQHCHLIQTEVVCVPFHPHARRCHRYFATIALSDCNTTNDTTRVQNGLQFSMNTTYKHVYKHTFARRLTTHVRPNSGSGPTLHYRFSYKVRG